MTAIFALFLVVFQQSISVVDSLKNELKQVNEPKIQAELYYQLARAIYGSDQNSAIAYSDSALVIALENNLTKLQGNALNIRGVAFLIKSEFDSAMKSHLQALEIREQIRDTVGLLESQLNIGNILYRRGNAREAAERYRTALYYARISENQRGQGLLFNNLGSYFRDLWAETKARTDLDSAQYYLTEALSIKSSMRDFRGSINTLSQLAQLAREEGDFSKAKEFLSDALEISDGLQDQELQISLLSELVDFNLELGNNHQALAYAKKAMEIAEEMNSNFQIASVSGLLAKAYEEKGDFPNALRFFKKKLETIQELNSDRNKQITEDLLIKYESEKKEIENQALLEEQKYLDLSLQRKNELLLAAGIILLGLIGVWAFQRIKNKQLQEAHQETTEILSQLKAQNQKIEIQTQKLEEANLALTESNRIRERLFSVLTHDLKTPITSLLGILGIWSDKMITQEEFMKLLPMVSSQIHGVNELMENLLEWAQAEFDYNEVAFREVNVHELADQTMQQLSTSIGDKDLHVENELPEDLKLKTDRNRLNFILRNLLANAIKFTPDGGNVRIHHSRVDGELISVSDTGVGMSSDQVEMLFSGRVSSQLGTQGEKGSGVGLLLCKEFALSLGADLLVESKINQGTTFSIKWPKPSS
ncbi:tetratricopeptide repeat-containing sensor histidine kinase [Algoriphagus sp.]|uniref:ATP-binding protein n=1 Tax=Algoriphagus sp. TaxID=1872435 RepID=UPI00260F2FBA|nr:tetratricopeptide repeat-containing sensor histidine kinase [Algoriphagus sp.]